MKTTQPDRAVYAPNVTVSRDGKVFVMDCECIYFHNTKGYRCVRIRIGDKRITKPVYRMVADCFLPARPSLAHQIRHLDGNNQNDVDTNLKWGTAKENAADREAHGHTAKGERNGQSKLTQEQVDYIRAQLNGGVHQQALADEFGVSKSLIGLIYRKEIWV